MVENQKKTKGFIETPKVIVDIMHFYLDLNPESKLLDLTVGKGALFSNHNKDNCYGIELDIGNYYVLQEKGYKNIIQGDVFDLEKEIENESMDFLILNPPYGKLANKKNSVDIMNIGIKKLKKGGKFAIINQFNYFSKFKEIGYFKKHTQIEYASIFDTELFKPFASVKTLLTLGIKGESQKETCDVWIFDNDKIKVNKRAKYVEVNLLKPEEKTINIKEFWDKIAIIDDKPSGPPTLQDFKKTIIDYMSFESGLPAKFIKSPELLAKSLQYFRNKQL
jgi:phospholipid N-methyltransferase